MTERSLHTLLQVGRARAHNLALSQTGAILRGARGAAAPREKSGPLRPPTARSKVNDAGILLNYVVIARNVYM